jgi:hypothetical protein
MNSAKIINLADHRLRGASKSQLLQMELTLRAELSRVQSESATELAKVIEKLTQREAELAKLTKKEINRTTNQPSKGF